MEQAIFSFAWKRFSIRGIYDARKSKFSKVFLQTIFTIVAQAARVPDNSQDLESLKKRDYFLEFIVSAAWHFAHQNLPVRLIYPAGKVSESVVDSHSSFMDFYSIAADGIFYNSDEEFKKIQDLAEGQRSGAHENGTWIFIREDPEPGESHFAVCE